MSKQTNFSLVEQPTTTFNLCLYFTGMFILFAFVVRIYRLVVGVTFDIVMWKLEQVLVLVFMYTFLLFSITTISDINNGIIRPDRQDQHLLPQLPIEIIKVYNTEYTSTSAFIYCVKYQIIWHWLERSRRNSGVNCNKI